MNTFPISCRWALLAAALLAGGPAAAQGPASFPGHLQFQYMSLTTVESSDPSIAKMLLAPWPLNFGEVYLEAYNGYSEESNATAYQHNQERLTRQLNELAADGWEVLEVHPAPYLPASQAYSTRYLLRRARR